ncbi:MAG: hypothetical protein IJA41_02580 [Clostridia bacterium]|nr:hypothetical protein [Clostridia bacterium]
MKKVLSILLAVLMLASLCTIAVTSVSAEEITPNDLGVTVISRGEITDDPTGTGEKVLPLDARNDRPNFELADPDDNTKKWEPVAGTTYTVTFDYYFTSGTVFSGFGLYYGAQSAYSANYSKSAITSANSGISGDFIGDGKWHSASMTFTAYEVKGKVNGVADQVLPYLYLTYYGTFKGYVKNINIVTESGSVVFGGDKHDFGVYFDENGAPKADLFHETVQYKVAGASLMTNSYVNAAGETVFVPTNDAAPVTNDDRVIDAYNCVDVLTASGVQVKNTGSEGGHGFMVLKYKVNKLGTSGKAVIGVGRASTTAGSTCLFQSVEVTEVSEDWQYLTYKMPYQGNYVYRVVLGGAGAEIAIDTFEYANTSANPNVVGVFLNDNGEFSVRSGYKGTDFLHNVADGANAENLAMGEKFLGWYSDSALTTEATKLPETDGTIFAKYPTTIVDFDNIKTTVKGWDYNGNAGTLSNGSVTVTSAANMGLMIPAYDSPATATDGRGYDYYQFANGAHYRVVVELSGIKQNVEGGSSSITLMGATAAGNKGARDSGIEHSATPSFKVTESSEATATVLYDFTRNAGSKGWETCGMGLRSGADKSNYTIVVDKIYITDMSLLSEKDIVAVSTRGASGSGAEYVSAGIRFKAAITEEFRASAYEIGFYAVPTAALNGMSLAEYVKTTDNLAVTAKVMDDASMPEILYAKTTDAHGRTMYEYQMILTGLTKEGAEKSLCNTKMTVVMYAVLANETVYTDEVSYSYNDFAPAQ